MRTVSLGELKFDDPILKDKFHRYYRTASANSREGWIVRPLSTFPSKEARGVYYASWAPFDEDGHLPHNYYGPREVLAIGLSAIYDADSSDPADRTRIVGLSLVSRWKPAGAGWIASLHYRTLNCRPTPRSKQPDEFFEARFTPNPELYRATPEVALITLRRVGTGWYARSFPFPTSATKDEQSTNYEVNVSTATLDEVQRERRDPPDADLRRILSSSEAMRDFGVREFEGLLEQLDVEIPSGKAVKSARLHRMLRFNEDPSALKSNRPLSDDERQEMLRQSRAEIERRIRILKDHHREMYQSLDRSFPIAELLQEASKK
ncbi:MAG: hypothetical protein IT428_06370 [Planctomycetaceae bacterium]|nr:hypothetical protein [Planctomycetaceae bacterium]